MTNQKIIFCKIVVPSAPEPEEPPVPLFAALPIFYQCKFCKSKLADVSELVAHVRANHAEAMRSAAHGCRFCETAWPSNTHLRQHMSEVHSMFRGACRCNLCGREYNGIGGLNNHVRQVHQKEAMSSECELCGKLFWTAVSLLRHRWTYHSDQPVKCEECAKVLPNMRKWKSHKHHSHGENNSKVMCEICGKLYRSLDVKRHIKTVHLSAKQKPEKPKNCPVCHKLLTHKGALVSHLLEHENARRFECDICGSRFNTKPNIAKHIVQHVGGRKFKCSVCGQGFFFKNLLTLHMQTHNTGRQFKCNFCDKAYNIKNSLNRHVREKHKSENQTN